jgi:Domain of unknown function (DUF6702)
MLKLIILNILLIFFHPVHVTLTSIDQAQDSDTLKVFFRMYYDDFLRDYKQYDPEFSMGKIHPDNAIPDDHLNKYFNDRVRIYINNKLLTGKLSAVSNDNIEITLSLLYMSVKDPEKFKIVNQVLIRLYSDQANMIFININKYQDAIKLTPEHFTEKRNLK